MTGYCISLTSWLTDWLTAWLPDWLPDYLTHRLADWLILQSEVRLPNFLWLHTILSATAPFNCLYISILFDLSWASPGLVLLLGVGASSGEPIVCKRYIKWQIRWCELSLAVVARVLHLKQLLWWQNAAKHFGCSWVALVCAAHNFLRANPRIAWRSMMPWAPVAPQTFLNFWIRVPDCQTPCSWFAREMAEDASRG